MTNKLFTGSAILLLAATTALAHENYDLQHEHSDLYRAGEMSLDLFGTATLGRSSLKDLSVDTVDDDTDWGLGLGLNYFFTRYFGLGGDAYMDNTTGSFVDSASLNAIGRFPLGESGFAPNVFGGGGRQFDHDELWFAQLGAGIEYRFDHQIALFLDARWVLPEETDYYGVARIGLRLVF